MNLDESRQASEAEMLKGVETLRAEHEVNIQAALEEAQRAHDNEKANALAAMKAAHEASLEDALYEARNVVEKENASIAVRSGLSDDSKQFRNEQQQFPPRVLGSEPHC